jgi:hypothetical protein
MAEVPRSDFFNWSTDDLLYTVSESKLDCWKPMYFAHVFFCYIITLSGIVCMVSRVHPLLHKAHAWSGRVYIISMLWATATSLLIHNTGLGLATLVSFVWVLAGMTLAWILILIHRDLLDKKAVERASKVLKEGGGTSGVVDLAALVAQEKGKIVSELTFCQRLCSLKALHGALMFMSWINIFGRIFASDQSGNFTCHTQNYFKPGYLEYTEFTLVPVESPTYARTPWASTGTTGWGIALSIGPLAFSYIWGLVWAGVSVCWAKRTQTKHVDSSHNVESKRGTSESKEATATTTDKP